ncbi:MAG: uracil-DNA glycosylase family protein [Acidobacteriota bacterium]
MNGWPNAALLAHIRRLHDLGVREILLPAGSAAGPPAAASHPASGESLEEIRTDLGECTRCSLADSRRSIVFGVGDPDAGLMFVGEGPGRDEDLEGEPFVGRAGRLLDRMIASIGLHRADVYIANIVKCRPPRNRNPRPDEIAACRPFLARQIEAIAPRVIVTLGKVASSVLLGEEIAITRARGQMRAFHGIPLMPTFHPAYLLRQYTPANRRAVYDDLLQVKALLDKTDAAGSG